MAASTTADHSETPRDKESPPGNDHLGSSPTLRAESARPQPAIPKVIAASDSIENEARKRSTNIFTAWTTLREVLRRHEATIQRRWLKKPKAKRLAVPGAAVPLLLGLHAECLKVRAMGRGHAGPCFQKHGEPFGPT